MTFQVTLILGTRPEAIKLAPLMLAFDAAGDFTLRVVLTGQHREMVRQVMNLFGLVADLDLALMKTGQTLTHITSAVLDGLSEEFSDHSPDLVLVQGDTTTAFAAALAAFYRQVPVGHVEAGLRTGQLFDPYPEEANRRLISQLARLHFAPTPRACDNLRASGVTGRVLMTGNTVIDALLTMAARQPSCDVPGLDWRNTRVILATVHRRENWGPPLQEIARGFLALLDSQPDTTLLLPLHPNPVVREPLQAQLHRHPRCFLVEPLDYDALVGAIAGCTLLLTDSGGLQEEAPALGKPVLVLRNTTERPEAVAAGTAKLIGTSSAAIVQEASRLLNDPACYLAMAQAVNPFGDGHASERIVTGCRQFLDEARAPGDGPATVRCR